MKKFYWMWFGQLISILASGITNFALGIWILKQSGSVMDYATLMVVSSLPGIVFTPFIGALVDRHNRKKIIIFADLAAAITTLAVAVLFYLGDLTIWHIYLAAAIDSLAFAFQIPALTALITTMVPKNSLGKAAGMNELSAALAAIGGPFFAGILIQSIDIAGVLAIDFLSFLFAATILATTPIPNIENIRRTSKVQSTLLNEAKQGWRYIRQRLGLQQLLIFGALINYIGGMVIALMMPLALQITDATRAGYMLAAGGVGSLLGGIFMALTGGPSRKIYGLLFGTLFAGVFLLLIGTFTNIWMVGFSLLLFNSCIPIAFGSELVIWQRKVESNLQGRVFAIYTAASSITVPLGSYTAGLFAEDLFKPIVASQQYWLTAFDRVSSPGGSIALLLVIMAIATIGISCWGWSNNAIRNIEDQLPDTGNDKAHTHTI